MSLFQRIRSALRGVFTLLLAVLLAVIPKESYDLIALLIGITLLIYGARMLIFYFSMARHMVGGKTTLYQSIIILDLSLLTLSIAAMGDVIVLVYLLFMFAFTGFIGVMRALEARQVGSRWRFQLVGGAVRVLFAISLLVVGVILRRTEIMVYGYCLSLAYSGVTRIVNAFRKTAIVYIQ